MVTAANIGLISPKLARGIVIVLYIKAQVRFWRMMRLVRRAAMVNQGTRKRSGCISSTSEVSPAIAVPPMTVILTMPTVLEACAETGLRNSLKVIIGGTPVSQKLPKTSMRMRMLPMRPKVWAFSKDGLTHRLKPIDRQI